MKRNRKLKTEAFIFTGGHVYMTAFFTFFLQIWNLFNLLIVQNSGQNKVKHSLLDIYEKIYITHEDYQYTLRARHSYNVIFICDIFFHICQLGSFPSGSSIPSGSTKFIQ